MTPHPEDLVTVIVPAYNAAATLDETLCSVRAQSYASLEISWLTGMKFPAGWPT